ncbi:hypothetical protein H6504_04930 [Candidatus Woesearchaeota archaeon]|nr:hypothetical protein [Candidatus Woesearchaeota archaeon]
MEYKRRQHHPVKNALGFMMLYAMLFVFIMLDIFVEIYHQLGFRLYGLPRVERHKYIKIDRHKLGYLSLLQKTNCAYCGYVNGLLHYVSEIAGRTEKHWCAIKHKKENGHIPPKHHKDFLDYGDEESFSELYK